MKFLVSFAVLTVVVVGSAFPVWLPLPQHEPLQAVQTRLSLTQSDSKTVPPAAAVSRLVGFVSSPVAAMVPSILVENYFYEGQYVRRGQVLAKLRVRSTGATAYLNAPHDGVLSRAQAQVGELLTPQTPLTTLTDQTRLLVRLYPAPKGLHPGDSVQVSIAHTSGAAVRGKITEWSAANTGPKVKLQLRKSVAGAAVGSPLTVAANTASPRRMSLVEADKGGPAPRRKLLHYSLPVAQE
jgi:hypothetical protein